MKKGSNRNNIFAIVICSLMMMFICINNASALSVCNGESFYIKKTNYSTNMSGFEHLNAYYPNISSGKKYGMNFYDSTDVNGESVFCIDPGKNGTSGEKLEYYCKEIIDPRSEDITTRKKGIAFEYAYQALMKDYGDDSFRSRYIGELVFRFLNYTASVGGTSQTRCAWGGNHCYTKLFTTNNAYNWLKHDDQGIAAAALGIYQNAINLAESGKTFDQLIEEGYIWGDQWEFDVNTSAQIQSVAERTDINKVYYTIKITSIGQKPDGEIFWDNFIFGSKTGYSVRTVSINNRTDYSAEFVVEIDKATGTSSDYGIYVETSYYDSRSAIANIMILQCGNKQNMLIISNGQPTILRITPTGPKKSYGGGSHKITLNGCGCDTSTGLYTCTKNGQTYTGSKEEIKSKCGYSDSDFGSTCPGTCQRETNAACSTKNGKYFCKDGLECDEAHYAKDCLCDSIPDNVCDDDPCTKDKNSEACKNCSFYAKYCVNCTPTLTLPKTCNNFDEYDLTNGIQNAGYISDIREEDCANDGTGSNVKMCVLGKNDATDTSFEYTEIEETKGNPYCKVYCKEGYRFDTPSAWHTTSGGYFKLQTTVFGQRDCYTAAAESETGLPKPIDEERYKADLKAATEKLLRDYNEFNKWKTAYYSVTSKSERAYDRDEDCDTDSDGELHCSCYDEEGCTANVVYVDSYDYTTYSIAESNGYVVGINSGSRHQSANIVSSDGYADDADSCPGTATCVDGSEVTVRSRIQSSWNSYAGTTTSITSDNQPLLLADVQAIQNIINKYNSCSSWTNNMTTNPEVTFSYDDMFNKEMSKGRMSGSFNNVTPKAQISSESNKITNEEYFYGDISNQYTAIGYSNTTNDKISRTKVVCDGSGCHTESYEMIAARWVRKSIAKEGTYTTDKDISTYTPYGTIEFNSKNAGGNDALRTQLNKDVIPISLRTKTGVFNFTIKYNNLGQSNSNGSSLGRVITTDTSKNSVLKAYNDKTKYKEEDKVCKNTKIDTSATMEQNAAYVCHYLNNCPDCTLACDDENNCEFNECNDNKCVLTCKNCIFDGNTTTYNYRVVSNNSLFNSNRDDNSGYNWNYGKGPDEDSSNNLDVIEAKGRETIKEIETQGNSTYEGTPEYSYILNATQMKNIRKYNSVVGSYNNLTTGSDYGNENALNCDYTGNYEGNAYKAHCRSKFLDYIHDGKYNLGKELSRNDKFEEYKGLSWK